MPFLLIQSLLETLDVSLCEATWQNVVDLLHLEKFVNSTTEVFILHPSLHGRNICEPSTDLLLDIHPSFHSRNISEPSKDLLLDLLNILLTQNTPQGLGLEKLS